jgi:rubrerythrin
VYNVKGGIQAWDGVVAEGPVELHLDLMRGGETPAEVLRLAYGMETSLGEFYAAIVRQTPDADVIALLKKLAAIEDRHKQYLRDMYESLGPSATEGQPIDSQVPTNVMEGGFDTKEFVAANEKFLQTVTDLLDVAMMLETQALDLYLRFSQKAFSDSSKQILFTIADEEKAHLKALGQLREQKT